MCILLLQSSLSAQQIAASSNLITEWYQCPWSWCYVHELGGQKLCNQSFTF